MNAESIAFLGWLTHRNADLMPVLDEHLDDQDGELLPHLMMADVVRWCIARISSHGTKDPHLQKMLRDIEDTYGTGSESIDKLIGASFLENLPQQNEVGADLRNFVGPKLKAQLQRFD